MEHETPGQGDRFFFTVLLDFIPTPIFFKDPEGRYQLVNRQFADLILGLPKEQILGRDLIDLRGQIPSNLAATYHARDLELMKHGSTQVYEAEVQCADGQRRPFSFHKATVTDETGAILGVVGVMLDITDRRMLEKRTVANEKMRAAILTAGAVNHEMSQPLQVISGMVELCVQEPGVNGQALQYLSSIAREVLRARDILRKLDNLKVFRTKEYLPATASEILDLEGSSGG